VCVVGLASSTDQSRRPSCEALFGFRLETMTQLQMQGARELMSTTPLLRFLNCQAWLALLVALTHVRPNIQDAPNCVVLAS